MFNYLVLVYILIIATLQYEYNPVENQQENENDIELESCDSQIIEQLSQSQIKFSINNESILVNNDNIDSTLMFNLNINDCQVQKTLKVSGLKLKMEMIILTNIYCDNNQLIDFQSLRDLDINSIQTTQEEYFDCDLIVIETNKLNIKNTLKCDNCLKTQIKSMNATINQIEIINSTQGDLILKISSEDQMIIEKISIDNYLQVQLISGSILKINTLIFFNEAYLTSCDIQMRSQLMEINTIYLGCIYVKIYTTLQEIETNNNITLQINNLLRHQDQPPQFFVYRFFQDNYLDKLIIKNIEIQTNHFMLKVYLLFKNILIIENIDANYQYIQEDQLGTKSLFHFEEIKQLTINKVVIQNLRIQIFLEIFCFKNIFNAYFNNLNFDTVVSMFPIMNFVQTQRIEIQNLKMKDIFYNSTAILIDDCIKFKLQNAILDFSNEDFYHQFRDPLVETNNQVYAKSFESWLKAYDFEDGSISFIRFFNFYNRQRQDIEQNFIEFLNIEANFSSIVSRFADIYRTNQQKIIFNGCSFSNMYSTQHGGCLRLIECEMVSVSQSTFTNCTSEKFGGALYSTRAEIQDSTFMNSNSLLGAVFVTIVERSENNTFINNTSKQLDEDFNYYTQRFQIDSIYEYQQSFINKSEFLIKSLNQQKDSYSLIPGNMYIIVLKFNLYRDGGDKKFNYYFNDILKGNMYQMATYQQKYLSSEIYIDKQIEEDVTYNKPYLIVQPKYSSDQNIVLPFDHYIQLDLPQIIQSECQSGQQKIHLNTIGKIGYTCQYCPLMFAKYDQSEIECQQCDGVFFSQCYGNFSSLNKGYWRESLTLEKTKIYQCEFNSPYCSGGGGFGNSLCTEGRIGIECSTCDILGQYWNQSYSKSGVYSCAKCSDISHNFTKILIILVGFIIFLFIVIHTNFKKITNIVCQQYLSKMNLIYIGNSFRKMGLTSVYIKILSFNASMIFFIQNQLDFKVSNTFFQFSLQYANPLEVNFISLDCLLHETFPDFKSVGQLKLYFYLTLPLVIIPLTLLLLTIKFLVRRNQSSKFLLYTILLSLIYTLLIVFFNSILSNCLDAAFCHTFQNGSQQSLIDYNLNCDKASTFFPETLAGIAIYCILVPFLIFGLVIRNRNRLNKISTLFKYGFLYSEYKPKYYYWEIIRFLIKIILIFIQKLVYSNIQFMNSLNILCLLIYLLLTFKLKPFSKDFLNAIETCSVLIVILNFIGVIIYTSQRGISNVNKLNTPSNAILFTALSFSFLFFLYMGVSIIFSVFENSIMKLQKYQCFQYIQRYFPFLNRFVYSERVHSNFRRLRQLVRNNLVACNKSEFSEETRLVSSYQLNNKEFYKSSYFD